MNIMIVGGGLLGRKTAETLDEAGHDVVLIDASPENLAQLSPDFSGVTAVGFPMDIKSLRSAGIEGCDAVAVTTPDDNLNITVGQILWHPQGDSPNLRPLPGKHLRALWPANRVPHQHGG